jgi:hypothetical protein
LTVVWLIPIAVSVGASIHLMNKGEALRKPDVPIRLSGFEIAGIVIIVLILLTTLLVAWVTPPQTWDSLNYRMSRVAHWAQNHSLKPFATGIEIQNTNLPGAELLFLHTYVLAEGDRYVNLVQWLAMIGSVVAAGFIAKLFGGEKSSIVLAAIFAVTIPMGIVEASSTMNDYIVALWVACFVVEVILFSSSKGSKGSLAAMSMSFGLAIITKPTAYAFLLPFVIWVISVAVKNGIWQTKIRQVLIGVLLITFLNLPHYVRTFQIFGQLIDPNQLDTHANLARTLPGLTSNTLRNFSLHMGTPSPYVNKAINLTIQQVHKWIGISINDPRTTAHADFRITGPTTNEIKAGNPLHIYSYFLVLILIILQRKEYSRNFLVYVGLTLSTMFIFSFVFKWQSFGSRYHMPFFILISPIVGVTIAKMKSKLANWGFVFIFSVCCLPWLLSIQSRPLIARDSTISNSILVERREKLYFGDFPSLLKPYDQISNLIKSNGCNSIGIALAGHSAEYPFWVFLGSPDDVAIEWIVGGSPTAKFRDPSFTACAVICDQSCPDDWEDVNGLPLSYREAGYRLYMDN